MSVVLSSREAEAGRHSHSEVSGQLEQEDKTVSPEETSGKSCVRPVVVPGQQMQIQTVTLLNET